MEGKVSQFRNFLSHFPQGHLLKHLPLEGVVTNGKKANSIILHFLTGKCTLEANIEGEIQGGYTSLINPPITAEDVSFQFAYHHKNNNLGVTNLSGVIRAGLPKSEKKFKMKGKVLNFRNYLKHDGDFEIALRDDSQEWVRIAGEISPAANSIKPDHILFKLDPSKSYFQRGHGIDFMCEVSDWENLEALNLSLSVNIPGVVQEVQEFVRCGLLSVSDPLFEAVNEWNDMKKHAGGFASRSHF